MRGRPPKPKHVRGRGCLAIVYAASGGTVYQRKCRNKPVPGHDLCGLHLRALHHAEEEHTEWPAAK